MPRLGAVAATLLIGTMIAGAGRAVAQESGRKIGVTAVARATYDDNVRRGQVSGTGLGEADYIYSPGIEVDVVLPLGRRVLTLGGGASYDFYQSNDRLNRERLQLDAGFASPMSRCDLVGRVGWTRGQSEVFDLTADTVQNVEDTKTVGVDLGCPDLVGLSPFVGVSGTQTRNSNARRSSLDNDSRSAAAGVRYGRPALGTVSLVVGASETRYNARSAGVTDGYDAKTATLGLERPIGSRLSGRASVGVQKVDSRPGIGARNFQGVTWAVGLTGRVNPALVLNVGFNRDVQPSVRLGQNFSVSETLTAGASYKLGSRINLSAVYRRGTRDFEGTTTPGTALKDKVDGVSLGAAYAVNRRWSLSAQLDHEKRTADVSGFGYDANRASVIARARF